MFSCKVVDNWLASAQVMQQLQFYQYWFLIIQEVHRMAQKAVLYTWLWQEFN